VSAEPLPPQNLDAEEMVLGAILVAGQFDPKPRSDFIASLRATGLQPSDFYRQTHARFFQAALALHERGQPTDALLVAEEIGADEEERKRLHELASLVPATANAAHHARLVVEKAERREEVEVAKAVVAAASDGGIPADPELRERVVGLLGARRSRAAEQIEFVTFDEFAARREPQAEPLVVDGDGGTVIAASGIGIVYGTGGAGKTTLCLDAAMHFAAGCDWLDGQLRPVRKLRVAWIENEGPREEFRRKIGRKLDAWRSRVKRHRLRVLDQPWSRYDLRRDDHRDALAREVGDADVDLLVVGPLQRLGMEGGGTPDEVRAFTALIEDVQHRVPRPVAFLIVHHENRAGQVSGAWEAVGDLLVHVQGQGHARLRVFWQKARWSSTLHATALTLAWAEGEAFQVEEKPELDDDTIAARIVEAISNEAGCTWGRVVEQTKGVGDKRRKAIRDRLLRDAVIVNVAKGESGEVVRLDHCPERRAASLYLANDPTIQHLRLSPAAAEPQAAAARGEGVTADLRPAAPPI
jgi:AAA domain/DnaB-like helicase N terminal domain